MNYIKGKFNKLLFKNEANGYCVALFRVLESDLKDIEGTIITVSGTIFDIKLNVKYRILGSYVKHPKYSWQFTVNEYELIAPSSEEDLISFFKSPFIEGCSEVTAKRIVEMYHENSLNKIKESFENLLVIKGMTPNKALKIYNSVLNYEKNDYIIKQLKTFGFTFEDASKIINKHNLDITDIMEGNLYILKDLFDFNKIDNIYINNFDKNSLLRIKECILNSMMQISFNEGSIYYDKETIYKALKNLFNINLSDEEFEDILSSLCNDGFVIKEGNFYYLEKYYKEEKIIAKKLFKMSMSTKNKVTRINERLEVLENNLGIKYNDEQKKAIINGLSNNVSIISGGPGTGKTTIVKAITSIYIDYNKLESDEVSSKIALLAPTGRAAKKLASSTGLSASTIHRFLGWHKDEDYFEYNEDNKIIQKFVIIDESSMIDTSLMASLLSAMYDNTKIIFVGDIYQLPSVGPGLILQDMINSDYFNFNPLSVIYRQSENSYIPFLAKDIKLQNIDEDFMYKRDDYNFILANEDNILKNIVSICKYGLEKGINEDNMQILAPIYKGESGIDNINKNLQFIYNPPDFSKKEISYGDKTFRENDKVMELVNEVDKNVFNGDIGKIIDIHRNKDNKAIIVIDFDGQRVEFEKKDLKNLTHAYAISIHKSQGSEFEHVIMPICNKYFIMLYNKLIYTGVSRAKKSLTIVGDPRSFTYAISNNRENNRNTTLTKRLNEYFDIKNP